MYKVFFNDRNIILTDDFTKTFQLKYGLFYRYHKKDELKELLDFYRNLKKIENLFIFHDDIEELRTIFRSCFKLIEAAGGVIKNSKGQLLVIKRRDRWDLPKGKLDAGESFEEAALREVEEECGIQDLKLICRLMSTYHSYLIDDQPVLKKTMWFDILYKGHKKPVPEQKENITEIRWVNPSEVSSFMKDTYGAIRDVLKYANLINL
ncbi:MAG: NUDIX domain-containing protein [Bacteroidales bacterium]|nr:NUDIX domain-containing protein [Bacteroidales bacterium]MBN2763983.1 NUDIX domain-containing protein [Bacteroidales bacterium]